MTSNRRAARPSIEPVISTAALARRAIIVGAIVTFALLGLVLAGGGSAARAPAVPPLGPLRYDLDTDIDYVDPALAYYIPSWQLEYATCAKLVIGSRRPRRASV